jgi:DNA-binding transcriptional LysR family regulator
MDWNDIRLLLCLSETGSMRRAAVLLGVRQPTVSRRLAALERALGYRLFQRSADGVRLNPEGEHLLEPARRMADWAGEFERAMGRGARGASGTVRVTAPPGVAHELLPSFAAWLRSKEPGLRIQALGSVHHVDLARGEADLAIRTRVPTQPELTCVATLRMRRLAFASPAYAKSLPKRYGFSDVEWICWAPPYDNLEPNPELEALVEDFRPSFTADNKAVQVEAARSGLGAVVLGAMQLACARPRDLVPLRLSFDRELACLHLVCAKSALDVPRVRTVARYLADQFQEATL